MFYFSFASSNLLIFIHNPIAIFNLEVFIYSAFSFIHETKQVNELDIKNKCVLDHMFQLDFYPKVLPGDNLRRKEPIWGGRDKRQ